jgi:hypothetical protein
VIDMMSVSALIDFLMNLMRDEDAQAEFDQDPQGTLSKNGLDGVSGQDVRDARMIMADDGGVRARPGHSSGSGSRGDDPIREIHHTTTNYVISESPTVGGDVTVINIDDRDTTVIDSFNSADSTDVDVTAIQDNDVTNIDVTDIDVTDIDIEDSSDDEPAEDDPAEGKPDGEEPTAGTDPVDGAPSDAPAGGEPTGGDPTAGDPTAGDPAGGTGSGPEIGDTAGTPDGTLDSDPIGIDPVDSEPVDSGPIDSGPIDSIDPVESEPMADDPDFDAAVI